MTNVDQNQTESAKMYRPWVGVLLSVCIPGASQFFAGKKLNGLAWFSGLWLLEVGCDWCLASPTAPGIVPGFILWVISIVLWIVMLVKSYRPLPRLRWFDWICFILLVACLYDPYVFRQTEFVRPFKMPTHSMSPTIQGGTRRSDGTTIGGDKVFVEKYAYWFNKPQRGDIIVFKTTGISTLLPENEFYCKRIIGIPGDVLSVQDGHLFNHGRRVTQPASLAGLVISIPGQGKFFPQLYLAKATDTFVVTNDCYFVLGDNTTNSFDSRFFGTVPKANIIGKVSKIYWPLNRVRNIQ